MALSILAGCSPPRQFSIHLVFVLLFFSTMFLLIPAPPCPSSSRSFSISSLQVGDSLYSQNVTFSCKRPAMSNFVFAYQVYDVATLMLWQRALSCILLLSIFISTSVNLEAPHTLSQHMQALLS